MDGEHKKELPGKRLALFFDGTWNEPADHTNVRRLRLMMAEQGADGVPQRSFYDEGVGTHWYDRISGGAFGSGLSENVWSGYRWLIEHYEPNDEIFMFGFSRGAFTARSLAGLIARCGLLQPDAPISFLQLYERYQKGDAVRPIYDLIRHKDEGRFLDFEEKAILRYSRYKRNFVKMVGVWDTVGSLGIPFANVPGVSRRTLRFHNTRLSTTVEHCYQALALNEYRRPYWAVLWTNFIPENTSSPPERVDNRFVEQRWFAGAHANLGGGYRSDPLPQRPLAWIQQKARACGLGFRSLVALDSDDLTVPPRDSYSEFLAGFWKDITLGKHHVRWIMSDPVWKPSRELEDRTTNAGWAHTVNERIDLSVIRRFQMCPNYRSRSIEEWAARKRLDLKSIIANPERHAEYWAPVEKSGIELPNLLQSHC